MSTQDWTSVVNALIGSWPSQVTSWGKAAIAAYCHELEARGVTPDAALVAIRSCPAGQAFPPSAPELAGLARRDPSRPTPEECYQQIYGPGGCCGFRRSGVKISPWVEAFVRSYGEERLRLLPVDGEHAGIVRRDLLRAYEQFLAATEGREVAVVAGDRRGSLGRLNPATALNGGER